MFKGRKPAPYHEEDNSGPKLRQISTTEKPRDYSEAIESLSGTGLSRPVSRSGGKRFDAR
jgi:hypothetical protein